MSKSTLTWIMNVYLYVNMFVCLWVCVYFIHVSLDQCVFLCLIHSHVCVCVCVFFLLLLLLSRLPSLIFVLTWGTTMKLRRFCAFCAITVIVDAIHICLQRLYFNFSFLDFNFLIFFFLLRLIRFNKFVVF